jgi:DNA invertase Pin-like site-specific DNA recombinase
MDRERIREILRRLEDEIPSPPFDSSARAARYVRTFVPDPNQVIAWLPHDGCPLYVDERTTNASRDRLIEDCRASKFDYIVTRSLTQFAPVWDEAKRLIRELKELNPPVGIFFETEMISTLDDRFDLWLATMETLAEMESREKSRRMIMGIRPTFQLNQEDSNA